MPRGNKTSPSRIEAVEKQALSLRFRKAGYTYDEIAKRVGYASADGAAKAVKAALHKMIKDDAKDVLAMELARLDDLLKGVYTLAEVGNQGAVDRVLRIMERRASYLGIDAPTKIVIEQNIPVDLINEFIRAAIAAERDPIQVFEKFIEKAHAEASARQSD